jgi:hypothetical protein
MMKKHLITILVLLILFAGTVSADDDKQDKNHTVAVTTEQLQIKYPLNFSTDAWKYIPLPKRNGKSVPAQVKIELKNYFFNQQSIFYADFDVTPLDDGTGGIVITKYTSVLINTGTSPYQSQDGAMDCSSAGQVFGVLTCEGLSTPTGTVTKNQGLLYGVNTDLGHDFGKLKFRVIDVLTAGPTNVTVIVTY